MNHDDLIPRHERIFGEVLKGLADISQLIHQNKEEATARRYEDRQETILWRKDVLDRISILELSIAEIKPNYRRMLGAMGFVIAGCLTATATFLWNHVVGRH
jgi:hypothetical protein